VLLAILLLLPLLLLLIFQAITCCWQYLLQKPHQYMMLVLADGNSCCKALPLPMQCCSLLHGNICCNVTATDAAMLLPHAVILLPPPYITVLLHFLSPFLSITTNWLPYKNYNPCFWFIKEVSIFAGAVATINCLMQWLTAIAPPLPVPDAIACYMATAAAMPCNSCCNAMQQLLQCCCHRLQCCCH